MSRIRYILFDAANTLIHKPALWERLQGPLKEHGYDVPDELLKRNHKLLSECLRFPDRTTKEFYKGFNGELLYSLGISPTTELLEGIFASCTYLPWEKFGDTAFIQSLNMPVGILSNFNSTLNQLANKEFGDLFKHIFISEDHGVAKPQREFYEIAVKKIGLDASEILYIGDSIKLDMEPGISVGMKCLLIDRDNVYPLYKQRISSLEDLKAYL